VTFSNQEVFKGTLLNEILDHNDYSYRGDKKVKMVDLSPIGMNFQSALSNDLQIGEEANYDGWILNGRWAQSSKSASRASDRITVYIQKKTQPKRNCESNSPKQELAIKPETEEVKAQPIYVADSNGKDILNILENPKRFMERSTRPASAKDCGSTYLSSSIPEYHSLEVKVEQKAVVKKPKKPIQKLRHVESKKSLT
jgi:hypothetical protein